MEKKHIRHMPNKLFYKPDKDMTDEDMADLDTYDCEDYMLAVASKNPDNKDLFMIIEALESLVGDIDKSINLLKQAALSKKDNP